MKVKSISKSIILGILCIAMLTLTVGCGCNNVDISTATDDTALRMKFRGVITEKNDSEIQVEALKKYTESKISKAYKIDISSVDAEKAKKIEQGKTVEIIYDGRLSGHNPAEIVNLISIALVDKEGNAVE